MISVTEFHRPKAGNSEKEYEDAFAWNEEKSAVAIADGATESSFSALWARALVSTFVERPPDFSRNDREVIRDIHREARRKWYEAINWEKLSWFQRNKAMLGSYSTLLGLQIEEGSGNRRFRCMAIGDSCLFRISLDRMESFPFSDSRDMGNTPRLLWSGIAGEKGMASDVEIPGIEVQYGWVRKGDMLMLATDALSRWMLEHKTEKPWRLLEGSGEDMEAFVSALVERGEMKNDDITLLTVIIS